jgi:hypothetical protein
MDRQTYGQIDRWTNEHMGKITNRYLNKSIFGQKVIETNREMEKQTNGQTDRWTNRQMDKQILGSKTFRKSDRWRNREMDK